MTSSIIVIPSIGAIRSFADFVAANVEFEAAVTFTGKVPEKSGQPFGVETHLEIRAKSFIELRDTDAEGQPVILSHALNTNSIKLLLNSVTTLSALSTVAVASNGGFVPDDLTENAEAAIPVAPTLTFGDSPLFNEYVLGAQSQQMRDHLISVVKNLTLYFSYEDEAAKIRNGATTIGEDGQPENPQEGRLRELDAALDGNREAHEKRRRQLLTFMNQTYLVLTDEGFKATRADYVKKDDKGKAVKVAATPASSYQPDAFKQVVENFVGDFVKNDAHKVTAEIGRFVSASIDKLVDAVKVQ